MMNTNTSLFIKNIMELFPNAFFWYRLDTKNAAPTPFPDSVVNTATKTINWEMIEKKDERYAISFTPNGDYYYSQKSRKNENARNIYAIVVDCDNNDELWKTFPIDPSIVVKTKNGHHVYWLLNVPVSYSSHSKQYDLIMRTLEMQYGADGQAKDIARMFRLPGTHHKKNLDDIFLTEVIKYSPELRYDLEDFLRYCDAEKFEIRFTKKTHWNIGKNDSETFDRIQDVNVLDVLSEFQDIGEKFGSIAIDGRWTHGYKYHKAQNYVKSFSGNKNDVRPTGGPFAVAKHFLKENKKVFAFFKEKFGIASEAVLSIPKTKKNNPKTDELIKKNIVNSKGGKEWLDIGEIDIDTKDEYNQVIGGVNMSITSEVIVGDYNYKFMYNQEIILAEDDKLGVTTICDGFFKCIGSYNNNGTMYYVLYAKKNGRAITKVVDKLHSLARLEYRLSYVGITFNGKKDHGKNIISMIHGTSNEMIFIDKAGVYPNGLIVTRKGEYILSHEDQYYYCKVDGDIVGRESKDKEHFFTVGENSSKEYMMDVVKRVCECHDPKITYPLFTIYSMGMLAHMFIDMQIKIPGALVYGNPGAGKSETIMNIQKILGIPKFNIQGDSSKFAFDHIAKHFLPIKVAEYDRVKQKFDVDTFLKNSYDRETAMRGTKEQAMIAYENNALFIVDGENRTMNPAVYSRNFAFHFRASELKSRTDTFKKMKADGYLEKNVLAYFIERRHLLTADGFDNLAEKYASDIDAETIDYEIQEKGRMVRNYGTVMAYLERMDLKEFQPYVKEAFIEQLGLFGDSKIDKTIKQFCFKALYEKVSITLNNEYIEIPAYIDYFRSDTNKAEDAQAGVMIVNSILAPDFARNNTDVLYIPHEYMQKRKNLHNVYNNILNYINKSVEFGNDKGKAGVIIRGIKEYAVKNGFTNHGFYTDTELSLG